MPLDLVTVFGGTGFLGRRIVARLRQRGLAVRVASRHPEAAGTDAELATVRADVTDPASLTAAVRGAGGVVNAVGHYVEQGAATFHAVHVEGAGNLAEACRRQGVERLVHLSGIGADPKAGSPYVQSRGRGEAAVREAFDQAVILRPSVMFARDDAFLTTLLQLVRQAPVIPLFGKGAARLQPVFADDVAEAVVRALIDEAKPAPLYALGGPEVYSYRGLLEQVMQAAGRRRPLLPLPFPVWQTLAVLAQVLPTPPLTEGQVALMKRDNVVPADLPGFEALDISPTSMTRVLAELCEET